MQRSAHPVRAHTKAWITQLHVAPRAVRPWMRCCACVTAWLERTALLLARACTQGPFLARRRPHHPPATNAAAQVRRCCQQGPLLGHVCMCMRMHAARNGLLLSWVAWAYDAGKAGVWELEAAAAHAIRFARTSVRKLACSTVHMRALACVCAWCAAGHRHGSCSPSPPPRGQLSGAKGPPAHRDVSRSRSPGGSGAHGHKRRWACACTQLLR